MILEYPPLGKPWSNKLEFLLNFATVFVGFGGEFGPSTHRRIKNAPRWRDPDRASGMVRFSSLLAVLVLAQPAAAAPPSYLEVQQFASWASGCEVVFFDLGANRGDSITRWFSGQPWSGRTAMAKARQANKSKAEAHALDIFAPLAKRNSTCTASFELNPRFTAQLKHLQQLQTSLGHKARVYTETVAGNAFGTTSIYLDTASEHAYGSSIIASKRVHLEGNASYATLHHQPMPAAQVDVTALVAAALRTGAKVAFKCDIEGGEYAVLRSLLASGVLCRLSVLMLEWHGHKVPKRDRTWPDGVEKIVDWLIASPKCGTVLSLDD